MSFGERKLPRTGKETFGILQMFKKAGWKVIRIWEHQIKKDLDKTVDEIEGIIERLKNEKANYLPKAVG